MLSSMLTCVTPELEHYAERHSAAAGALFESLADHTRQHTDRPQMQVGRIEGSLLKLLCQIAGARRALEIGTFTGYSTLKIAEGLAPGGTVTTLEIDPAYAAIAQGYFDRSPFGSRIEILLGPAQDNLQMLEGPFDLVFIDADKERYPVYYQRAVELLRPGGVIVVDNVLWSGRVSDPGVTDAETEAIRRVNQIIASDHRVEAVMLTVRDGITIARRRT